MRKSVDRLVYERFGSLYRKQIKSRKKSSFSLIENQKKMRRYPTAGEKILNGLLKLAFKGKKVYSQYIVATRTNNYILDFYMPEFQLAFEADGFHHHTSQGKSYDWKRDRNLRDFGIQVVRINNSDLFNSRWNVLKGFEKINKALGNIKFYNQFQDMINNALGWRSGQCQESESRKAESCPLSGSQQNQHSGPAQISELRPDSILTAENS